MPPAVRDELTQLVRLHKRSLADLQGRKFAATQESIDASLGDPQHAADLLERQEGLKCRLWCSVNACHGLPTYGRGRTAR